MTPCKASDEARLVDTLKRIIAERDELRALVRIALRESHPDSVFAERAREVLGE